MMNLLATLMLPTSASNLRQDIDMAWNVILYVTGFFFLIVVAAMLIFIVKYRRRTPNDVTSPITHNTPIEIAWTAIPLALVLVFFYVGFKGFMNYDNPPSDCVVINAEAQQWQFTFTYPNGGVSNDLYLLINQPVRIEMTSKDVLHALYIPEFGTQRNFVPGRVTYIWFQPTLESDKDAPDGWPAFCTQYCGDGHSRMFSHVFVLSRFDFDKKMAELANPFKHKDPKTGKTTWVPYVQLGETLYKQMGCSSCHSTDEAKTIGTGPPWRTLYGRDHQFSFVDNDSVLNTEGTKGVLNDKEPASKWEDYMKESMLKPDAALVKYNGKDFHGMPSFAAQLSGSASNVEKQRALADYIKSIGGDPQLPYKPDITPESNPELFDADKPVLFDENHEPVHPESLAGIKARAALTQPASRP